MSHFTNPKLAAIDDALTELDPIMEEFGHSHGFTLACSHEGSFNVPRRWLRRHLAGIRHEIGLIVASPMPERLARGFYPDIPCTLYLAAFDGHAHRHFHSHVFEERPFRLLRDSLNYFLTDALVKLDACTSDFVAQHGLYDQKG